MDKTASKPMPKEIGNKPTPRQVIPSSLDRVDFNDPKVIAAIQKAARDFDEDKYRDRLEQFETKFQGDGGVIWP